jgi:hypothetical protein
MFDTTKPLVSRDEGSFATEFNAQTKSINFPKEGLNVVMSGY